MFCSQNSVTMPPLKSTSMSWESKSDRMATKMAVKITSDGTTLLNMRMLTSIASMATGTK